jgi:sulfatase maturation enzyme AslB (radical SAM superfamily)
MTNLMLTSRCNLNCDFCFAVDIMGGNTELDVSFKTFQKYIDHLDHSGMEQARLLGGEPTIHPKFPRFLNHALSRGKTILIFSNGLIPEAVMKVLEEIPPRECTVLVNLASGDGLPRVRRRQEEVLTRLGQRACSGYTISRLAHLQFPQLLDIIDRTGSQRCLRIAMAQPSGGSNIFIHPKQYRQVARLITELVVEAGQREVRVEFDCGFVRCMFSNEDLLVLQENNVSAAWHCSPVWDVAPDAMAFPCFALAGHMQVPDGLEHGLDELQRIFSDKMSVLRIAGVYPECSSCELRVTEKCSGGCLAVTMKRLRHTPMTRVFNVSEAFAFING